MEFTVISKGGEDKGKPLRVCVIKIIKMKDTIIDYKGRPSSLPKPFKLSEYTIVSSLEAIDLTAWFLHSPTYYTQTPPLLSTAL